MAPFPFLQRDNPAEYARRLNLTRYTPEIKLEGLFTGVDNVRHDVFLSAGFTEPARQYIFRLLVNYGGAAEMVIEPRVSTTFRPPSVVVPGSAKAASARAETADFKRLLSELLVGTLNRAKNEGNISVDLLARLAVVKFLRAELPAQFNRLLERCRANLAAYDGPRNPNPAKLAHLREVFAQFQVNKKNILRKAGQELFETCREVEKEQLARMRRSLFGDSCGAAYELFLNRLLFTEEGHDDYLNADHYVLLGNLPRDPDRYESILKLAHMFFASFDLPETADPAAVDAMLCAPENAQEILAGGAPEEGARAQRALLAAWVAVLEQAGVMRQAIAAYEVVPLLAQYSPPINAQQLKNALIVREECRRVERLLEEQGKMSPENLWAAVRRVALCRGAERAKLAGRFLLDFMRYHRDLHRLSAVCGAMDAVNVIANERIRNLSAINNTLYEFLMGNEQKPAEERVLHHVVLKADVRDSTTLTRSLLERGLNPASHFSLNFYEPVNKLVSLYGAQKVFIEGDAVILATFEHEGEPPFAVARTCNLAREILEVMRAYNEHSRRAGLPILELGIGISYQDSPPLYLMDGATRIMISKALNESDRLSSCSKLARKFIGENQTWFSVYTLQTVADDDAGGNPDEFLVRYNLGGIHINEEAFCKLQQEISLRRVEQEIPTIWKTEHTLLYWGTVPLSTGGFHTLVVREARVPRVEPRNFSLLDWTERRYYEVCTSPAVYKLIERSAAKAAVTT